MLLGSAKRFILISFFIVIGIFIGIYLHKQKSQLDKGKPISPTYYAEKVDFFRKFNRHADIVMIGDSLTDGAEWSDIFPDKRIANRAIGGDTTAGLLNRMESIYSVYPKTAFLMIGINDLFTREDPEKIIENYKNIVENLKKRNIQVFVESILLCNPKMAGQWTQCRENNKKIKYINKKISALGNFIDLNAWLSDAEGLKPEYTNDGVHLMANGYLIWKSQIEKRVDN